MTCSKQQKVSFKIAHQTENNSNWIELDVHMIFKTTILNVPEIYKIIILKKIGAPHS
jgi:hypothetical protein